MKTGLHNKLVLHTADLYIEKALENECYQREALLTLHTRIMGYKVFHRFSPEESDEIQELGNDPFMVRLKGIDVDWACYSIFVLAEWINLTPKNERPQINFSDKKIKLLQAAIVKDMLNLKLRNKDEYDKVKSIIDQTRMTAKKYVQYSKDWKCNQKEKSSA